MNSDKSSAELHEAMVHFLGLIALQFNCKGSLVGHHFLLEADRFPSTIIVSFITDLDGTIFISFHDGDAQHLIGEKP